jgi:hypothetical protein
MTADGTILRGALAGGGDECRHDMRASVADDPGSVDDSGKLLGHRRALKMLPGGTPASLWTRRYSAASASRSGPAGPHSIRR